MGSAYGFAKFAQLNVKWKKREGDITKQKLDTETPQMKQMREEAARIRKSNIISSIDAKLKGGGELTSDELEYLKENSPELYREAVEIARERQAYKKALENCRTKEDVAKLNSNKMNSALNLARTISSNANIPKIKRQQLMEKILKTVMGIQAEHVKFIKTPRYTDLPREQELIDNKKKKKTTTESETAEAPDRLELNFEETKEELKRLMDGVPDEKTENSESTEQGNGEKDGAEKGNAQKVGAQKGNAQKCNAQKGNAQKGSAPKGSGEAPRSHSTAKVYTASGDIKTPPSPSLAIKKSIKA